MTGRPKREVQGIFYDLATKNGWDLISRGWPTFLIEKEGGVSLVWIKPSAGRRLRAEEQQITELLTKAGVSCYTWSTEEGFAALAAPSDADVADSSEGESTVGGEGGDSDVGASPTVDGDQLPTEVRALHRGGVGEEIPFETESMPAPRNGDDGTREKVAAVWAHYVAVMKPRHPSPDDEQRRIIRAALQVATVEECCAAIDGCATSAFHMGDNDKRRKYNKLSQILKGRRGHETTRERIDFFLDRLTESGQVPSASPAVISARQRDVQRGHRFKDDDPAAVEKARQAEDWLKLQGIVVVRQSDGYPTFKRVTDD